MTADPTKAEHQACCAYLVVEYATEPHPSGLVSGYWECKSCWHRFAPIPLPAPDPTKPEEVERLQMRAHVVAKAVCNINGRVSDARLAEIIPVIDDLADLAKRVQERYTDHMAFCRRDRDEA